MWPTLFALSQLEIDPVKARALRQQAREIVTYIADRAGTSGLRDLFLNQPLVCAVLDPSAEARR